MPTNKPRITFTISRQELEKIDTYRFDNKFKNQTQAILSLLDKGLDAVGIPANKKSPALSSEAMRLAKDYDTLDGHGQRTVRLVADEELSRMVAEARKEEDPEPDVSPATKSIPLYQPFAAGSAEPYIGDPPERYEVPASSRADFAIRINGTSMEPYLRDQSVALGVFRAPRFGEVCAAVLDGEYLVKQYVTDILDNVILLSLNRDEADRDVVLRPGTDRSLMWIGTILMDRKPPLPKV